MKNHPVLLLVCLLACVGSFSVRSGEDKAAERSYVLAGFETSPHEFQVALHCKSLRSSSAQVRRRSAESLGYLRAYEAAEDLALALKDESAEVRREAAMALAWCGGRKQLSALEGALSDPDWSVRQSAWVALSNLTGMEFPFDALAKEAIRAEQVSAWRKFLASIPADKAPDEILAMLGTVPAKDFAEQCKVSASSTYKGPPSVLTGGDPAKFWQTKEVKFPQQCTIDLGAEREIGCVTVEQYGPGFCMTDCGILTSEDGKEFKPVYDKKARTKPRLVVHFEPRKARHVRIVSRGSENPRYPTTFYRVHVHGHTPKAADRSASPDLRIERGLRALGVFGGSDAADRISAIVTARRSPKSESGKLLVQAGIRSLGRLGGPVAVKTLTTLLNNAYWARYAADALGDCPSDAVTQTLVKALPTYARDIKAGNPKTIPGDDKPGFEPIDRAFETPFAIAAALARMPLKSPEAKAAVRQIAPLLLSNLASDFDGAMLYEPEAPQLIASYLLERAGLRAAMRDLALVALKEKPVGAALMAKLPADVEKSLSGLAAKGPGGTSYAGAWLPVLCRKGECTAQLTRLLTHANGWVRINAAKALIFNHERAAVGTLTKRLSESKPEAEYGYFGGFLFRTKKQGQDDYNAPSPCWREAFTRAVGALGGEEHVDLLVKLLRDERNVLEVQYAAAVGLNTIGTPEALSILKETASTHPFHSIRLLARESLWRRGLKWEEEAPSAPSPAPASTTASPPKQNGMPGAIVFIKGDNDMPNDFQIDIWRQTYSTTDSGPTYRLGSNLYALSPVSPDGKVTPLTNFTDGYVADCEVSWDGQRIVFARRNDKTDPWWHICEIGADGKGFRQLTSGPYHDVQPNYLPDGRIVFSSSRIGHRDEYHGYPATGLTIMNPDGSDIHCIGFNLGRDNEPSILADGRIAFSRLELFYSRLKTELTVQAVFPDGTKNVTLYGPERRAFWQEVTKRSKERWPWGEVPPRHRVLRLTQPQPYDSERLLCASTGGPVLVGPGRLKETFLPNKGDMAVTSMYPLKGQRLLCAATKRAFKVNQVDLGLYTLNAQTGEFKLLYNDPKTADFEPRPIAARPVPPVLSAPQRSNAFSARLLCSSAHTSQEALTRERGRLLRIIEGQPIPSRHHTHTSSDGQAWKNHVGTDARVLGTVPLAADGSFFVEIPADRLIHCQVLDSDRRVVGNQLIWMYARPNETKSCIGCHEIPDSSPRLTQGFAASARVAPLKCMPTGGEFSYRAKAWQKGYLKTETEERTRTVQAINLLGRY